MVRAGEAFGRAGAARPADVIPADVVRPADADLPLQVVPGAHVRRLLLHPEALLQLWISLDGGEDVVEWQRVQQLDACDGDVGGAGAQRAQRQVVVDATRAEQQRSDLLRLRS